MIAEGKHRQALRAVQIGLTTARAMAYGNESHSSVCRALEYIEALVVLIMHSDDKTDEFRETLIDLSGEYGRFGGALQSFEQREGDC